MNILMIGSGAREHAIAKAFKRSSQNPILFCCGSSHNPGILALTKNYWVGNLCDKDSILKKASDWQIDMAIIGPEAPLEQGLADILEENNIGVIGPKKKLARIETSKSFTRELLKKYQILGSPQYRLFDNREGILDFLQQLGHNNYVVKANGLMGGKGVKVAGDHLHSFKEALQFCEEIFANYQTVVIEEKVVGQEFSLLYFCDGNTLVPMPLIQDHKRAFLYDKGPNTGGMGSFSCADHRLPFLTHKDFETAHHINQSMLTALTQECRERYIGILYSSFMATKDGVRLIEYNARFGDPEAINALSILETDLVTICKKMIDGHLSDISVSYANYATVCKYAVPEGYPDQPIQNTIIDISAVSNPSQLFFGAVDLRDEQLITLGSRAIAVLGIGDDLSDAEKNAENTIKQIKGKLYHRQDIGTNELIQMKIKQMKELRQC